MGQAWKEPEVVCELWPHIAALDSGSKASDSLRFSRHVYSTPRVQKGLGRRQVGFSAQWNASGMPSAESLCLGRGRVLEERALLWTPQGPIPVQPDA